jgi:hypothetical protein
MLLLLLRQKSRVFVLYFDLLSDRRSHRIGRDQLSPSLPKFAAAQKDVGHLHPETSPGQKKNGHLDQSDLAGILGCGV